MASSDSKFDNVPLQFKALTSAAASLNTASQELSKVIDVLDEALKKLHIGLTVWSAFRYRDVEQPEYDQDEIGYSKVDGTWGITLRRVWGNLERDEEHESGPWHFNDAPRNLRLAGVDAIPNLIEALFNEAVATTKQVHAKTEKVRELASVIERIANSPKSVPTGQLPTSVEDALKLMVNGPFGQPNKDKAKGK
jgi:hypothetical protein